MTAYVVVEIDVNDPEAYAPYIAGAGPSVEAMGGTYVVRGGGTETLEGDPPRSRIVVLAFADRAAALAWYHSPAYQAVAPIRHASADSRMYIVDGI